VTILDNLSTGRKDNLTNALQSPSLRFVHGSILDALLVNELTTQCDKVVHLAAAVGVKLIIEQPLRSLRTNLRGSEIVIEAAHRYCRNRSPETVRVCGLLLITFVAAIDTSIVIVSRRRAGRPVMQADTDHPAHRLGLWASVRPRLPRCCRSRLSCPVWQGSWSCSDPSQPPDHFP
jgi:GDP-mannose 4,6 dehydratase